MCWKWEFGLVSIYKGWNGKFWLRNLDLPICVTGCHTDGSGRGKVVMGGYAGVVIKIPILVLPVLLCWCWMMMVVVVQWGLMIVVCLTAGGWWRTYNGFSPHLWMNEWWGLTVVWCLIHFLVGGAGSSPTMSPSWAMVWDLFHFPFVALPVPPRYTLPNSSLDSCLAQTSNFVQASLAVLPLKNLCLRCSQQLSGSIPWFLCKRCHSEKQDLLQPWQYLFYSHLQGGSCIRLR